jgi:undecaprenyl-diphosphatase
MELLYLLEKIRNPFFDLFFSLITHIGEETFFLAIAIFFFWCVNKREGYYILITGLVGTVINQGLKLACRVNRPWIRDPFFTPVESAIPEATGYSFPSGHTQNVAGTFGAIAMFSRKRRVKIASIVLILLVSFSRMYLGVHTPLDVGMSLCIACILVIVLHPIFTNEDKFKRYMPIIISISAVISVALVLYAFLIGEAGVDAANLASAKKNASTLFGCLVGLIVVYPVDRYVIDFKTSAKWYSQIIKLTIGLGVVLLLKSGLKSPLESLIPNVYVARAIRYFIIVIFAGIIYPLTFNAYSKLKIKCLDNLTDKVRGRFEKNNTGTH